MKVGIIKGSEHLTKRLTQAFIIEGHCVRKIALNGFRSKSYPIENSSSVFKGLDVVINLTNSIADDSSAELDLSIHELRIQGTENIVRAIGNINPPCHLIQQSAAALHLSNVLVDETSELSGLGDLSSALVMEMIIVGSKLKWTIIRSACIYDPDSHSGTSLLNRIEYGLERASGHPKRWISFIHIDDLISVFLFALSLPTQRAYIACDDRPTKYEEILSEFGGQLSTPANAESPKFGSVLPSFRVSNELLRSHGWQPRHPSIFSSILN